jgi:hypothetical protein
MKQLYTLICAVIITIAIPHKSFAQCACASGDPADSVVQIQTLSGILSFNTPVFFNKFDPATGALNCLTTRTSVLTVLDMDLVNRDSTQRVEYSMVYTRVTTLTGPGISVTSNQNRNYGPFDLGQAGVDADTSVHVGPDTLFKFRQLVKATTNVVPYLGSGTVAFNYFNNGSYLMTNGNDNYGLDVAAFSEVTIRLTYYFCPNVVLPSGMKNFQVKRNNRKVQINWVTENEKTGNTYKIEMSANGRDFVAVNKQDATGIGIKNYAAEYDAKNSDRGRLYFRVQQTDVQNRVSYSPVKTVSFDENGLINPSIFPNPAVKTMNVQFESAQTGTLSVELVNTTGQVLQQNTVRAVKTNSLQFDLKQKYPRGSYWLRVRNLATGEQSVNRVALQ